MIVGQGSFNYPATQKIKELYDNRNLIPLTTALDGMSDNAKTGFVVYSNNLPTIADLFQDIV